MKKKGKGSGKYDYSKLDPDAISDKYSGQALNRVIKEKREEEGRKKKKAKKKK